MSRLVQTLNYRVYIEVVRKTPVTLSFNNLPTVEYIVEALWRLRAAVPHPMAETDEAIYKTDLERFDNLVSVLRLATQNGFGVPARGKTYIHEAKVAGIYIGKVVVKTIGAWTIKSDQENG